MVTFRGKKLTQTMNLGNLGANVLITDLKSALNGFTSTGFIITTAISICLLTLHTEGSIQLVLDKLFDSKGAFYRYTTASLHKVLSAVVLLPVFFIVKLKDLFAVVASMLCILLLLPNATYMTYAVEMFTVLMIIKFRNPVVRLLVIAIFTVFVLLNIVHHHESNTLHTQVNDTSRFFTQFERTCNDGYHWDSIFHRCEKDNNAVSKITCGSDEYLLNKLCKHKSTCVSPNTWDANAKTCK